MHRIIKFWDNIFAMDREICDSYILCWRITNIIWNMYLNFLVFGLVCQNLYNKLWRVGRCINDLKNQIALKSDKSEIRPLGNQSNQNSDKSEINAIWYPRNRIDQKLEIFRNRQTRYQENNYLFEITIFSPNYNPGRHLAPVISQKNSLKSFSANLSWL